MADLNFVVKNGLVVNTAFVANSSQITLGSINSTSNGVSITPTSITIGNSSINSTTNSTSFNGTSNNSLYLNGVVGANYALLASPTFTGNVSVGSNVIVNTSAVFVGNATVNAYLTSAGLFVNGTSAGVSTSAQYAWTNTHTFTISGSGVPITVYSNLSAGIVVYANTNIGIQSISNTQYGVYGLSNTNVGVYGISNTSYGIFASSLSNTAVYASSFGGIAGSFRSFTGQLIYASNNNGSTFSVENNGSVRSSDNITAYYSSDISLKENITIIPNALDKVNQIRGVTFDWTDEWIKNNGGEDGYFVRKHDVGVIAQEIEAVLPEVVATRVSGSKAVKYERIVPLLIEAIKELKAEIEQLKGN